MSGWKTSRSRYGREAAHAVHALDATKLRIGQGDFVALVGP